MHPTPRQLRLPPRTLRAFTLIEIMVVIAIIGILFRLALSVYQSNVLKSKRYAAQSCLMEYSQYMERYYTTNTANPMQYTGASLPVPGAACAISLGSAYTITLSSTASTYTLTAAAQNAQVNDSGCASLTLQQDGAKAPASCWP